MVTVTIPKEITKGEELVVIPRKLYEEFLHVIKGRSATVSRLNEGLKEAFEDVKKGRLIGPFSSLKEGLGVLKRAK